MLVVQAQQIDLAGLGEVGHGGGGRAGHDEGGVDVAAFQGVGAVIEGMIAGHYIVGGHIVGGQYVQGVEINAAAVRADGDLFARQIGHRLDLGIQGDDLHLLGVEGGHHGKAVGGAQVGEEAAALVGVGHDVGLAESQVGVILSQFDDVGLGTAAGLAGDAQTGLVGGVLGDEGSEFGIHTALVAGDEDQVVIHHRRPAEGPAAGGQAQDQCQNEKRSQGFFHGFSSVLH